MISPNYKNFRFAIFCTAFILCNLSTFAQVGIGTTDPETMFHIKGEYVAPVSGEISLLEEDFQTVPLGTYANQINNRSGSCPTDGWAIANNPANKCTPCSNRMLFLNSQQSGCTQNTTAIVPFGSNPTSGAVTISFDYRFRKYNADIDYMNVYLYNESDSAGTLIFNISNNDSDSDYSGTWPVTASDTYSLRFQYFGTWGKSVTMDNIKVTEQAIGTPGKYAFKLEDGTQAFGYVLTSDADGNATWQTMPQPRPDGSNNSSEIVTADRKNDPETQQLLNDLKYIVRERETTIESENEKIWMMEAKIREFE